MLTLPPDRTPLYNHTLPALEDWLRQRSASIELDVEELVVCWHQEGHRSERHFPYGLSRADVEAAILAGP
jgi:hypothetical protein